MLWLTFRQIKSENWKTRKRAVEKLKHLSDPKAFDALILALNSEYENVREAAAEALGRIGDARAVAPLAAMFKEGSSISLREAVARSLISIGEAAAGPLAAVMQDKNSHALWPAVNALRYIENGAGLEPLIAPLVAALVDEDKNIRDAAKTALERINANWENNEAARTATPALIAGLTSKNTRVRASVAWALGKIRDPRAIEPLVRNLKDPEWPGIESEKVWALTQFGEEVVAPLTALLESEDPDSRRVAAEALAKCRAERVKKRIEGAETIDPLVEALKDEDRSVRLAAIKALVPVKKAAVEPLAIALADSDVGVQRAALAALVEIGEPCGAEPLCELLRKPLQEVLSRATGSQIFEAERLIEDAFVALRKFENLGYIPKDDQARVFLDVARREYKTAAARGPMAAVPLLRRIEITDLSDTEQNTASLYKGYFINKSVTNAIRALESLLETQSSAIPSEVLDNVFNLRKIKYGEGWAKTDSDQDQGGRDYEVDTTRLKTLAQAELARRQT